jgi:glycosyltransferase involved in cell wall biosynthesis
MHGVTHTIAQIRDRGVPGFEVEVLGTDRDVDRRLSAVADVEIPFYPGMEVGVPSLPAVIDALGEGAYDLIHLATPGPAGVAAWMLAGVLDIPRVGSYHTELGAYASLRSGQPDLGVVVDAMLKSFYGACELVLSPSPATDRRLGVLGIDEQRIGRWERGVDLRRFDPRRREDRVLSGEVTVLYTGRLTKEKGVDLLAEAFLTAHQRDSRLHLALAGGGPEEDHLRRRLEEKATFLGWLHGDELPRAYASADIFLFPSQTDTYGQAILEAQASGLPVVAVGEGGPRSLIAHGETGLLAPAQPGALADHLLSLAGDALLRERIRRRAQMAVRGRTWKASLEQLACGYRHALDASRLTGRRAA